MSRDNFGDCPDKIDIVRIGTETFRVTVEWYNAHGHKGKHEKHSKDFTGFSALGGALQFLHDSYPYFRAAIVHGI